MEHQVVAPQVGESITEVTILRWAKADGEAVKPGEVLLEIETDKATVEVAAETSGALKVLRPAGETVKVGEVLGFVDDAKSGSAGAAKPAAPVASAPIASTPVTAAASPSYSGAAAGGGLAFETAGPAVRKMAQENNLDLNAIPGTGKNGRVTKGDVLAHQEGGARPATSAPSAPAPAVPVSAPARTDKAGDRRVPMSRLRVRIAERLVESQHTAAILTTFNEVDMSPVMAIRNKHKDAFKAKFGATLSFMSFFTRAVTLALQQIPVVNATIDGKEIVYHDYCDVGIAVGTERGLVVPVIRSAEKMSFLEIEKKMAELALKAREGKLSIPEMTGGTFTISNGGTYGSLLSTPILNPPQSGILGMHKIQERAVVVNGKVEARPMMYLALSYDHRLIDGKEAVTFLVVLRDLLENPEKLGMEFVGALG
jgi:2-oxoglutarate dehydrogenase E2 component (dihydrolipoamide succinyltransferase)